MKRTLFLLSIGLCTIGAHAQQVKSLSDMSTKSEDNVTVEKLDDDKLASTFVIWVKESVAEHYHAKHTEVVYVVEGYGMLSLDGVEHKIGPGDYVFIPKGTKHSVNVLGDEPMKVLSVQTPHFDGKDRIYVSQD